MASKQIGIRNIFSERQLIHMWEVLLELIVRDTKIRYQGSILGLAWSFMTPLLQLVVFYLLFRKVLLFDIEKYPLFAFIGILSWNWFQSSVLDASEVVRNGSELIRQPGFPNFVLPIVSVTTNLINFFIAIPILILVLLISGIPLSSLILALPLVMIIQFIISLGLAYLVATVNVFFRDTRHILGVLLLMFFFMTPIFYDISGVPEEFRLIYNLNPMVHIVDGYRAILMKRGFPDWEPLLIVAFLSILLLGVSFRFFVRASYRFIEEV